MATFNICDRVNNYERIFILVATSKRVRTLSDRKQIILRSKIQDCFEQSGGSGTIVIFWDDGDDRTGFLAPASANDFFNTYFASHPFQLISKKSINSIQCSGIRSRYEIKPTRSEYEIESARSKNDNDPRDPGLAFKDYSSEVIRYNEKEFSPGSPYYHKDDDCPPRCRSCGSDKLSFYVANNQRFWICHDCGRQSGESATYNPKTAIPAPHNDPIFKEGLEANPELKELFENIKNRKTKT